MVPFQLGCVGMGSKNGFSNRSLLGRMGTPKVGIIGMESEVHVHSSSINESEHKMRRANQPRLREPDVDQFERSRRSHMPTKPETRAI